MHSQITLFLTIIQCKRVKHFYFFLQEKQMCDRGCGKVLKGSKLGKVFSSLKQKEMCKESGSHRHVQYLLLVMGLFGDTC